VTASNDDPKRKGQQGRRLREGELPVILAFAKLHGNREAAKKFKLAVRTIERHNGRLAKGADPELAGLVAEKVAQAAEKNADLLEKTLEAALQRTLKLLPKATIAESLEAVGTLSDVKAQRDFFGGDAHAGPANARKDQAARATPSGDARAALGSAGAGSANDPPVH
jgi:hypothetical protein